MQGVVGRDKGRERGSKPSWHPAPSTWHREQGGTEWVLLGEGRNTPSALLVPFLERRKRFHVRMKHSPPHKDPWHQAAEGICHTALLWGLVLPHKWPWVPGGGVGGG